jgi:predicted transcriptional regulator
LKTQSLADGSLSVCCRVPTALEARVEGPDFLAEKMRRTAVRNIMSSAVTCVDSDLGWKETEDIFDSANIHAAPVVDDRGVLIGMVSRSDLSRMHPDRLDATCSVVDEVMNACVPKIGEWASLADTALLLATQDTQRLVVVSQDEVVVGTVSAMDLVRWIASACAGPRFAQDPASTAKQSTVR